MLQRLKCASVGVLALVPAIAFAQEAAPEAAASSAPTLKLTPTARAQVFSTLSDSTKNGFNFDVFDARIGANGEYGVAKFKLDVKLPGDKAVSEANLYEAKVGFSTWLGTLNTGRIRNTEFVGYGLWDERWTPGFGAIDGIQLATAHEFGPAMVSAGITLGNGLDGTWIAGIDTLDGNGSTDFPSKSPGLVNGSAAKTDLTTVLTLGVEVMGAKVYAGLGMEPNRQFAAAKAGATTDDPATTDVDETKGTPGSVADLTHAEIGLGYGMEGVSGGLWYAVTSLGEAKAVKENKGGTVSTTGDALSKKIELSMLGLGVTVDSRLWGMTNLLQDGDRLAFGLNYSMFTPKSDGKVVKDADGKELSNNQIGLSAGYNAGDVYNMNLHFVMDSSDAKQWTDTDGKAQDSRTRIVLETGVYL